MPNLCSRMLLKDNIDFILHDRDTLGNGLELDFFLPEKQIAIECQGLQHFEPVEHFGGISGFKKRTTNDKIKREKCKEMGIEIIYFSDLKDFAFPYNVFTNKKELREVISNGKSI